uniref:Cytochrome b5 heme-binding domain-containing protein n=1 Tax=Crocodylus porosus TaxID=8502 RepID=A0A7M4F688_CROPO
MGAKSREGCRAVLDSSWGCRPPDLRQMTGGCRCRLGLTTAPSPFLDLTPPAGSCLLSATMLARYMGTEGLPGLYLAMLGQVFDVRYSCKQYGPGGAYSGLACRDVFRAFMMGDFTVRGLVDDVLELPPWDTTALHHWLRFYQKQYGLVDGCVQAKLTNFVHTGCMTCRRPQPA